MREILLFLISSFRRVLYVVCFLLGNRPTPASEVYMPTFPCMLYAFFWVIPRCLKFICRLFGTLCLFHLHRQVDVSSITQKKAYKSYYIYKPASNVMEKLRNRVV